MEARLARAKANASPPKKTEAQAEKDAWMEERLACAAKKASSKQLLDSPPRANGRLETPDGSVNGSVQVQGSPSSLTGEARGRIRSSFAWPRTGSLSLALKLFLFFPPLVVVVRVVCRSECDRVCARGRDD